MSFADKVNVMNKFENAPQSRNIKRADTYKSKSKELII